MYFQVYNLFQEAVKKKYESDDTTACHGVPPTGHYSKPVALLNVVLISLV